MTIKSIEISNFKCFDETGKIEFSEGFNIILGKNNVGKTALLDALSTTPKNSPHKSKYDTHNINAQKEIVFQKTFNLTCKNVRRVMFSSRNPKGFSIPSVNINVQDYFKNQIEDDDFQFCGTKIERKDSKSYLGDADANFFNVSINKLSSNKQIITIKPDMRHYDLVGITSNIDRNVFDATIDRLNQNIFKFDAERFKITKHANEGHSRLNSSADNLASCLLSFKNDDEISFDKLRKHLNDIFPNILNVITKLHGNHHVEIFLSSLKPIDDMDHMRIAAENCGTGVSQALAILFVVLAYNEPRTIIIDEPNSFLHPAAAKKLIKILKQYDHHQYIISTHSSEVLKVADPDNILLLTYEDGKTNIQQVDKDNMDDMRFALTEIGVAMSDVFSADNILWVEGKTEEDCFKEIAKHVDGFPIGTSIVSDIHTSDVGQKSKKQSKLCIDIYKKLSQGDYLIPSAVGFIFDRENKTDTDIDDLKRLFENKVEFLDRRMFEDYLLHPEAVAYALNELPTFKRDNISVEIVENYFNKNIIDDAGFHAADFLKNLFEYLTDAKETHVKTRDNLVMTKYLLKHNPDCFDEIVSKIKALLS